MNGPCSGLPAGIENSYNAFEALVHSYAVYEARATKFRGPVASVHKPEHPNPPLSFGVDSTNDGCVLFHRDVDKRGHADEEDYLRVCQYRPS